jgi:outer membrane protein assembly factor BamB
MKYSTAVCITILSSMLLIPLTSAQLTETNTPLSTPTLLWNRYQSFPDRADNSLSEWSLPTIADGVVYVGSISMINFGLPVPLPNQPPYDPNNDWSDFYALNASNGAVIWDHYDSSNTNFVGSSAVSDGRVFSCKGPYSKDSPTVTALNASTGDLLWNYTVTGEISSPAVSNGLVYIASTGGFGQSALYALNETDGNLVWCAPNYGHSQPKAANGIVYIGLADPYNYGDPEVYCLNALNAVNGKFLWNFTTHWWPSPVAVAGGAIYFSADNNIYALNAATGAKIWNYTTPPLAITENSIYTSENMAPTVKNGILYFFSTRSGTLLALKASNGAQLWNCTGGLSSPNWGDHPTVADGIVYVNPRTFSALNAFSGHKIWEYSLSYYNFPIIADGVAYYSVQNGPLYALKLPDFTSSPPSTDVISALIDDGSKVDFSITGNLTSQQVSNAYLTSDKVSKTFVYLTVSQTDGIAGFSNITIPKNAIIHGVTPTVYINDQKTNTQGYSQDADKYYVWYTTQFGKQEISIIFTDTSDGQNLPQTILQPILIAVIAIVAIGICIGVYQRSRKR